MPLLRLVKGLPVPYCAYCKMPQPAQERGERYAVLYPATVVRHSVCGHVLMYRSGGSDE